MDNPYKSPLSYPLQAETAEEAEVNEKSPISFSKILVAGSSSIGVSALFHAATYEMTDNPVASRIIGITAAAVSAVLVLRSKKI